MITPQIPHNDDERIRVLYSYGIFDSIADPELLEITELTKSVMGMPISYISFMDKYHELFLTARGIRDKMADRSTSFCGHAISDPLNVLVVNDARKDLRFFDNPWVTKHPHIVFYAAAPLINPDGHAIGTLCVIDFKQNNITQDQIDIMKSLAAQAITILEKKREEYRQLKRVD